MGEVRVPAVRLRPPSWRDGRLIVGVVLVLLSIVIGARIVSAAGHTEPLYSAAADLPSGHQLRVGDLHVVAAHLAAGASGYLSARSPLPAGTVLMRPVGAGELVPTAALGPAAALVRRPVSVPVPAPLPAGLRAGAGVDLWSSAKENRAGTTSYASPVRIARAAEVYAIAAPGTGLAASGTGAVQVLLDEGELRAVLDALANEAKIALVPVPSLPLPHPGEDPAREPSAPEPSAPEPSAPEPSAGAAR
ncbi:MAG: hypothetical protein QG622_2616 [Actinomycetota bacterium]|nr:hypothetical protein [Actinomycetota bacterium]